MVAPISPLSILITCTLLPLSLSLPSTPSSLSTPPRTPLLHGFHLSSSDLAGSGAKHHTSSSRDPIYNPLKHALVASAHSHDLPNTLENGPLSPVHAHAQALADGLTLVSSADARIVYTGSGEGWHKLRSPSYKLGHTHQLNKDTAVSTSPTSLLKRVPPARATFTFTGTGIEWWGGKSPLHGQARVLVDGKELAIVDCYSSGFKTSQKLWSIKGLAHGMHELAVEPMGTAQRRSRGVLVDVEAFGVVGLGGGKNRVEYGEVRARAKVVPAEPMAFEEDEMMRYADSWERRER